MKTNKKPCYRPHVAFLGEIDGFRVYYAPKHSALAHFAKAIFGMENIETCPGRTITGLFVRVLSIKN